MSLTCIQRVSALYNVKAYLFKDGVAVVVSHTGSMSLRNMSIHHKGSCRCEMLEGGESPSALLIVAGEEVASFVSVSVSSSNARYPAGVPLGGRSFLPAVNHCTGSRVQR